MTASRLLPAALPNCTWQSYRLPAVVLPDAYRLTLQTVLEDQSTVTGRVEINLHAEEPTHCIVMHAVAMSVDSISIISSEGSAQQGTPQIIYLRFHKYGQVAQILPSRHCRTHLLQLEASAQSALHSDHADRLPDTYAGPSSQEYINDTHGM